jgi:acetyl-CoA carboxylase biotin carboxylase subunit
LFKKILVANRGEIAVRIMKACNELGIRTAAIFSEPDRTSLYTRYADESYPIGGYYPSENYLNISKIISIGKEINADAIHPGYGFLSENYHFIKAVEESGITFIGPSSNSVKLMGSKTAARELMRQNSVPIVPGTTTPITSQDDALTIANQIGYPILLKASAGGGGKGMKKVYNESEFENAFNSAQREALKAFGDDSVYIEKLIERPKHIEVQIFGDKHGNYVHLFERDCSIQRRHQKVIEEAPSMVLDDISRNKITQAAINAAKACNYYNAGTIEFLMDDSKNFYFLEMNTRLQVEHPVTELITGTDLVIEQIKVAAGEVLSFKQEDLKIHGHSIECRVYAEDPDNNFLPTSGKIIYHRLPSGPGVRVDRGVDYGSDVTLYYDPLLTKITVYAKDRASAIKRLNIALSNYLVAGITTNLSFLKWIVNHKKYQTGDYDINFIEHEFNPLIPDSWKNDLTANDLETTAIFAVLLKEYQKNSDPCPKQSQTKNNNWKLKNE